MLSAFVDLGNALLVGHSDDDISNLISIPKKRSNTKPVIGIVEFNTTNAKVSFNAMQLPKGENINEIAKRYRFVGNPKGNKPQWALTTSNLGYLLTDSIINLQTMTPAGSLRDKLENISKVFFRDINYKDQKNKRAVDLSKLDLCNLHGINLDEYCANQDSEVEKRRKDYLQGLSKEISKHLLDQAQEALFWTVSKDGELLCNLDEYDIIIRNNLIGEEHQEKEIGICSICGKKDGVSYEDTKNLEFKYFITDKISFASDIDPEGFNRNMAVCKSCLKKMITAEKFLKNDMNVSIGGNVVYLIPSIHGVALESSEIKALSNRISKRFNKLVNYKSIKEIEDELASYSEEFSNIVRYTLTLIFQKKKKNAASSDFKISRIIEEIPDTRIDEIFRELRESSSVFDEFGVILNLQKMFYNLQSSKGSSPMDRKFALEIIASIIAGGYVSKYEVMKRMMENLRQTVVSSEFKFDDFCLSIAEKGIFIMFLEIDKSIVQNSGGENNMNKNEDVEENVVSGMLDNEIKKGTEFLVRAKYSAPQKGLFWIGYLSGKLMSVQYRRLKKQPLLDKIGYKGMGKSDLIQYDIELLEAMKNYDLFGIPSIQKIHYIAHSYIDRYLNDNLIVLSREEIPFYIMAGISYEYFTRKSKEVEDEEREEEI